MPSPDNCFNIIIHLNVVFFKRIIYKILRIDDNKKFYVKQRFEKANLLDAFELKPSCLADISEKTRGASYCYAIIKDYLNS